MTSFMKTPTKIFSFTGIFLLLMLFVAACGGSEATPTASTNSGASNSQKSASISSGSQAHQGSSTTITTQYLIKTLNVSMQVKDTRQVAADIQTWITTTDSRGTTTNTDYEQTDNHLYTVSMTFSVQATIYPQIYTYLRDYTQKHGGQQTAFTESTQDITNDYVDTQSRLKNLRIEQQRLQTLMGHAQAVSDVITVEQKLSDVEGQIEQIEAHLNLLNGQVSFYNINVSLQPIETTTAAIGSWNIGQTFQQAFAAVIIVGEVLLTLLVWLLMFSLYLLPITAIIWFIRKRLGRTPRIAPVAATTQTQPPSSTSA